MYSKWFKLKEAAVRLRRQGKSVREVEKTLGIPRSTLSGWFKNVKLTKKQQLNLKNNRLKSLIKARERAVIWHNQQKDMRLKLAEMGAEEVLARLDLGNVNNLELSLAMLYLGEGLKTKSGLGMGNSDPLILKFFGLSN